MRLVLAIQFWAGDKEAAMRNARRIADIEPHFREDVEFCFVARFDCEHDKDTIDYVSKKFKTSAYTSKRRGIGWPSGCNDVWFDFMQEAANRYMGGDWQDVKAVFTFESDCVPIAKDWIDEMSREWDIGAEQGKLVCGCWSPYCGDGNGHINGNALFHPYLTRAKQLVGCSPIVGWDDAIAPVICNVWHKAGFVKNLYRAVEVSDADIESEWIEGKRPVLIHGVKDLSVERYADRVLFSNLPTKK